MNEQISPKYGYLPVDCLVDPKTMVVSSIRCLFDEAAALAVDFPDMGCPPSKDYCKDYCIGFGMDYSMLVPVVQLVAPHWLARPMNIVYCDVANDLDRRLLRSNNPRPFCTTCFPTIAYKKAFRLHYSRG